MKKLKLSFKNIHMLSENAFWCMKAIFHKKLQSYKIMHLIFDKEGNYVMSLAYVENVFNHFYYDIHGNEISSEEFHKWVFNNGFRKLELSVIDFDNYTGYYIRTEESLLGGGEYFYVDLKENFSFFDRVKSYFFLQYKKDIDFYIYTTIMED